MNRLTGILQRCLSRDDGQDLLEYAMVVALIVIVAVTAVGTLGQTINTAFWQLIAQNI